MYILLPLLVFSVVQCDALTERSLSEESEVYLVTHLREYSNIYTRGLTSIFWEKSELCDDDIERVEHSCTSALRYLQSQLVNGSTDAYELLDASSKGLVGVLDGVTVAYGEYDPCLSINVSPHGRGQYCSVTVVPTLVAGLASPSHTPSATFHLCLPSLCSAFDLHAIIARRLTVHPLKVPSLDSAITCDSLESTSLYFRLTHLSLHQLTSIVFICILLLFLSTATLCDIFNVNSSLCRLSLRQSITSSSSEASDVLTIVAKFLEGCLAVTGCMASFVIPRGVRLIEYFSPQKAFSPTILHALNDLLIGSLAFVAGFKVMRRKDARDASTVIFYRYTLVVSLSLACEFVWPLLGDGPTFTSSSTATLNECNDNWWHHYTLHVTGRRGEGLVCASHLYLSSINLTLYLTSIVALYTLKGARGRKILALCSVTSSSLLITTCFIVSQSLMKSSTLSAQMPLDNLSSLIFSNHFHGIHFHSLLIIHGFILGIMVAAYTRRTILSLSSSKYTFYFIAGNIFTILLFSLPHLQLNQYFHHIIESRHFFTLRNQVACHFALSVISILLFHFNLTLQIETVSMGVKRVICMCSELTPSILLTSSIYARWYFHTSRQLMYHETRDVIIRWTHAFYIVTVASLMVHFIFIRPFTHHSARDAIKKASKID